MRFSTTLLNALSKGGTHPSFQAVAGEPGHWVSTPPAPPNPSSQVTDRRSPSNQYRRLDQPPVIDFERPYSQFEVLEAEEWRLQGIAKDIRSVQQDLLRFDREGAENAAYAATWAATLMVAVLDTDADSLLGIFATPETIAAAKANSALKGVLDGSEMGRVLPGCGPTIWSGTIGSTTT